MQELEHLENLDLSGNPVTESEDYKAKVFEMLPNLMVLDGMDDEGNEVITEDEGEEGEEEEDEYS